MSRKLSHRERRVLLYGGQPASLVAVHERMSVSEVLEVRARLRSRGVTGQSPQAPPAAQHQLDVDELMRTNRAPRER